MTPFADRSRQRAFLVCAWRRTFLTEFGAFTAAGRTGMILSSGEPDGQWRSGNNSCKQRLKGAEQ